MITSICSNRNITQRTYMKHIKEWFTKWLNGIQKPLLWILVFDLLIIVCLDIFGRDLFKDEGTYRYRLFTFAYTLGLSYIASFIFYFVQVHLKEVKDRNRVLPSLEVLFRKLVHFENEIILDTINSDATIKKKEFKVTTKEDYLSATKRINTHAKSNVYQGKYELSWLEYHTYRRNQIDEFVHLVLEYSQFIGEEGMSLLADIRNDSLLYTVITNSNSCKDVGLEPAFSLDGIETICGQFYDLVQRTNDYYTKELLPYKTTKDKSIKNIYLGKLKQIAV